MGWIKRGASYDPDQMHVVIGKFLEKAREVLLQEGMKTGMTASVVDQWAQRIWMVQGEGELAAQQVLESVQMKEISQRLVLEVSEFKEETQMPQAIFLER